MGSCLLTSSSRASRSRSRSNGVMSSVTNASVSSMRLDELLTRAQAGPVDKLRDRVVARTRVAGATHRRPPRDDAMPPDWGKPADGGEDGPLATVIPFGIFDADAEAERW